MLVENVKSIQCTPSMSRFFPRSQLSLVTIIIAAAATSAVAAEPSSASCCPHRPNVRSLAFGRLRVRPKLRHEEKRRLRGGLLLLVLTWKTVTLPVVALDPAPPMTPPFGVPFFQKARHLTTPIGIYLFSLMNTYSDENLVIAKKVIKA